MTPQDLLEHFGTQRKIADFFGCSTSTVSDWFQSGEIPPGRQYEAQVKTAGLLMACSCRSAVPPAPTSAEAS